MPEVCMVKERQNGSFVRLQEEENGSVASSYPHASTSEQDQGIEMQPSLAPQSSAPGPASTENYQHVSNVLGEAFYNAQRFSTRICCRCNRITGRSLFCPANFAAR